MNIQLHASAPLLKEKEPPVSIEWVGVRSLSILDVLEKEEEEGKKKKKKKKKISYLYTKLHYPDLD